jgi:hypothetical protein
VLADAPPVLPKLSTLSVLLLDECPERRRAMLRVARVALLLTAVLTRRKLATPGLLTLSTTACEGAMRAHNKQTDRVSLLIPAKLKAFVYCSGRASELPPVQQAGCSGACADGHPCGHQGVMQHVSGSCPLACMHTPTCKTKIFKDMLSLWRMQLALIGD